MGTCSYVLTGTDAGFKETFGSTCHGAGASAYAAEKRLHFPTLALIQASRASLRSASHAADRGSPQGQIACNAKTQAS